MHKNRGMSVRARCPRCSAVALVSLAFGVCQRCRRADRSKAYRDRLRRAVLDGLGGRCACCGETEESFLEVDHIHDDGANQRRVAGGSLNEYRELVADGCPRENHQLLCSNCNLGKQRNGGICPHIGKPGYPVAGARYPAAEAAERSS